MKNYVLIKETTFEKARKKIVEAKKQNKITIFSSADDELNRKVLEKLEINVLLINLAERKDFQKQRNSGFNHVLAKIAKKNKIIIGINLDEIIGAESKSKANILARVRQNVKLCNKNKLQMEFFSEKYKKDKYDLKALGGILGMPTYMVTNL